MKQLHFRFKYIKMDMNKIIKSQAFKDFSIIIILIGRLYNQGYP